MILTRHTRPRDSVENLARVTLSSSEKTKRAFSAGKSKFFQNIKRAYRIYRMSEREVGFALLGFWLGACFSILIMMIVF